MDTQPMRNLLRGHICIRVRWLESQAWLHLLLLFHQARAATSWIGPGDCNGQRKRKCLRMEGKCRRKRKSYNMSSCDRTCCVWLRVCDWLCLCSHLCLRSHSCHPCSRSCCTHDMFVLWSSLRCTHMYMLLHDPSVCVFMCGQTTELIWVINK